MDMGLQIDEYLDECEEEYQAEMAKQIHVNELEQEMDDDQVPELSLKRAMFDESALFLTTYYVTCHT